jgi:Tat protein secretion system quality control protein TatD with DNase activity
MCYSAMYGGRSGRAKGKAPKGKKSKCALCDAKGHTAADCPDREEMAKQAALKTPLGFGKTHKTSRKASARNSNKMDDNVAADQVSGAEGVAHLLTEMFPQELIDLEPFFFFDAGCDVGASLDSLATLHGSGKKGKSALTSVLSTGSTIPTNYGGCLCRMLVKPDKPWDPEAPRTTMILETDPLAYFVVGLGPGFMNGCSGRSDESNEEDPVNGDTPEQSLDEMNTAVAALLSALDTDPDRIVGLYHKLDYTPETVQLHGYDKETQLQRLRATCTAARQGKVPIQCRIAPGAPVPTTVNENDSDDEAMAAAYGLVIKDLARVLLEMSPPAGDASSPDPSPLYVHLSCWNGTEPHMMHLLSAFPDTLYVGMNATAGFAKNKLAHECAFSVPLDRLLLETDAPHVIPAPVVAAMGRKAFGHAGCIPFVASAVAQHKRGTVTAVDVARQASHNTIRLYGRDSGGALASRAAQAAVDASARAVRMAQQKLLDEEAQAEAAQNGETVDTLDDEDELMAQQLLEEMAAMDIANK